MKRVKKFGRGGDILTGIGAALVGKALYDKYTASKDSEKNLKTIESPKSDSNVKPSPPFADPRVDGKNKEDVPAANKDEARESSGRNSDLSPVEQHAAITRRSNSPKPVPAINKNKNKKDNKKPRTAQDFAPYTGKDNDARPSKLTPNTGKDNDARPSRPYPVAQADATKYAHNENPNATALPLSDKEIRDIKAKQSGAIQAEQRQRKGQGLTPYAPSTGPGSSSHAQMLRDSRDPEKVKQRLAETKRRDEENARKRKGMADTQYDNMGNVINKRGGMVKKMASGGKVKSASARADGCAIRGKTRA